MPVVIKDIEWKQTKNLLTLKVPIKTNFQPKVDIFTSPKYIKASYDRYFFETLLLHPIDTNSSKCTIEPKNIIFELIKITPVEWDSLEPTLTKNERQELKQQLLDEEYARIKEIDEQKKSQKHELKRTAVREQIALETKQREQIENIKKEEKNAALGDIKKWNETVKSEPKIIKKRVLKPQPKVPAPRCNASLEIDFTPREFPTPCRESRLEEEDEWLRKQAIARRSAGFVSEDLRPEEKNPQYLKAKGEEFLKAKNYLGAISAFSFGIKINAKFVDFYILRSEAHFAIGNFHKTIQDCSAALDLLKPAVKGNFMERVTCISRRGQALCKMGMSRQGLEEIDAACGLARNDKELLEQLEAIRDELEP